MVEDISGLDSTSSGSDAKKEKTSKKGDITRMSGPRFSKDAFFKKRLSSQALSNVPKIRSLGRVVDIREVQMIQRKKLFSR
jgi:hypothetical protein